MNNEQSRFIRWGIPGWTMFLAFFTFIIMDVVLSPDTSRNHMIQTLEVLANAAALNSTASAAVALLVAASGIPLGFLIYQVYFYIRWNSPFSRDGLFPPFITGRWDDLERIIEGIDENDLVGEPTWCKKWTSDPLYKMDLGWKSRYIENMFLEIVQNLDYKLEAISLYGRYRYLLDLMHTLGSGLFGIYLGYLAYLMLSVKTNNLSFTILIIVSAVTLFFVLWLLEVEDIVRNFKQGKGHLSKDKYLALKPFRGLPWIQFSNPSAIYLFFLFAVLYIGSPSPYMVIYPQNHILLRLIVIALMAGAWIFSKRHYPLSIVRTELITFILSAILATWISQTLNGWNGFQEEWWSIGWAILLFLFTNLIFTKNRQNIRDDLIALQNYTFKRSLYPKVPNKPTPPKKRKLPKG